LERYEYIDGITSSQPKFDNSTFTVCMNPGITISKALTLIFVRPDLDIQKKKGEELTRFRSRIYVPK